MKTEFKIYPNDTSLTPLQEVWICAALALVYSALSFFGIFIMYCAARLLLYAGGLV